MSGCEVWEELLLQYQELEPGIRATVDLHLAVCAGCRDFLAALETIDMELSAALCEVEPAPGFDTRVRARAGAAMRTPRPGLRPGLRAGLRPGLIEALDGIGWLSVAGILAMLAAHGRLEWAAKQIPAAWFTPSLLQPVGVVLIAGAAAYGLHTWRELAG